MKSICIPIHNQSEFSQIAIQAVLDNTTDCELIIVDNGSTPPFKPPFSGFIETTLIRNEENLGFPAAVNQAIRAAKGDVIVLLNSDVIVTPKWSEKLLSGLDEFSIVGPATNFSAGIQGVQPELYASTDGLYKVAEMWSETYQDAIQEVNWVIGFCMAFRKSLFEEIGEFDESLWPCSGEEIDFCLKARATGHKIGIVFGCYVHHEGSMTFKAMDVDYKAICIRNDEHLSKKWGADFWVRQLVEDEPEKTGVVHGKWTYVDEGLNVQFPDDGRLIIGNFCSIAKGVNIILGGNHRGDWLSTFPFPEMFPGSPDIPGYRTSKGNVIIGNDVWIGQGATILSGVTIADGAIVGAGSVVSRDVAPYSVVCGNPAEHKKYRFNFDTIAKLLKMKWWHWSEDKIRDAIPILMSGDIEKLIEYEKGQI